MTTEELRNKILDWCDKKFKSDNITSNEMKDISEIYVHIAQQDNLAETMGRIANGGSFVEPTTALLNDEKINKAREEVGDTFQNKYGDITSGK